MSTYNILCWVRPMYLEKMMGRFMDDCCEFSLHITCERRRFGAHNYRGVWIRLPEGCSDEDIVGSISWVSNVTEFDAIFQSTLKKTNHENK